MTLLLRRLFQGATLLLISGGSAMAVDGVAVELGHTTSTDMFRVAAQWQWRQRWLEGRDWHLGGYWDAGIGWWARERSGGGREQLGEIGFTPTFRLQSNDLRGLYLEAGIGVHLLSQTTLDNKNFSTAFQFGDHAGIGYRFGAKGAFDVSYRYQHLSNADIKRPNPGINFHQIRLQYWLR